MTSKGFGFLRPYLCRDLRPLPEAACRSHLRFHAIKRHYKRAKVIVSSSDSTGRVRARAVDLKTSGDLNYPRIERDLDALPIDRFRNRYEHLKSGETDESTRVIVRGRVRAFRAAGPKLLFIDLVQDGRFLQGMINIGYFFEDAKTVAYYQKFHQQLQRGDIISLVGYPHRTARSELSIVATELPEVLSRCLHPFPEVLLDSQLKIKNKHVDLLVNQESAHTLRLRSQIVQRIREFLLKRNFTEVETPILADGTGGAMARSFKTSATEFPERELSMRIAPELWLKRLVLGGFDRIFEIGRCFRNEGLDPTHNPEFTTCEFYMAYVELRELMELTESLIVKLALSTIDSRDEFLHALPSLNLNQFTRPFARLDFIPALEKAMKRPLPQLSTTDALTTLLRLFEDLSLPPPTSPPLPRLRDKLAATYLEPQCQSPTFILHAPECLSPLAKSFDHPENNQRVSARAELFVHGRELVNTYEEENDPFEQRRKFVEQARWRDAENEARVDENYLQALEWGLPPTGGWGCGVDRLCMLFAGRDRIADVLSFGSLRNVVALRSKEGAGEGQGEEDGGSV